MHIGTCGTDEIPQWVALRFALWPDEDKGIMAREAPGILAHPDRLVLVARDGAALTGFAEASLRRDYVNGCETSPVAFVEGIYVVPRARSGGVARALIAAIEHWAKENGMRELASDALLENSQSHAMHEALGFSETECVVYFRKPLT
ncbi:MAG: GNAT family N-acetyltransferase [Alphaproteobacteria bacterium]|nr:GNAT family N-acetyltransferase [Alphaproteobacteria bacterium]